MPNPIGYPPFFPQALFSQPMVAAAVIIHLVTDGLNPTDYHDQKQETISVQLVDTKDQNHDLGKNFLPGFVLGSFPLALQSLSK